MRRGLEDRSRTSEAIVLLGQGQWVVEMVEAYRGLAERLACDGPGGHAHQGTCQHDWNRPSNQLETGWERNRNGERGRGDGGGGPEEGVLEERFRRSRFSLGDGITFAVIGGRHECLRP